MSILRTIWTHLTRVWHPPVRYNPKADPAVQSLRRERLDSILAERKTRREYPRVRTIRDRLRTEGRR